MSCHSLLALGQLQFGHISSCSQAFVYERPFMEPRPFIWVACKICPSFSLHCDVLELRHHVHYVQKCPAIVSALMNCRAKVTKSAAHIGIFPDQDVPHKWDTIDITQSNCRLQISHCGPSRLWHYEIAQRGKPLRLCCCFCREASRFLEIMAGGAACWWL